MDIDKILVKCRFSKRYMGYRELKEGVRIVVEDENELLRLTGIYQKVAERFSVSKESVERNMRTVINRSWDNGGREPLEKLCGGKLYDKPSNGEVLEIISYYIIDQNKQEKAQLEK